MLTRRKGLVAVVSIILLAIFLLSAGCRKMALYQNLSEEEANEIMVVLYEVGISADKDKEVVQNETFWSISVAQKDLPAARRMLVERNLPRKREMGLSGVYKEKGLIPTPDEQKARFLLAMKGEIVNSLERIPEVVDADVVINIPTPEEFSEGGEKRPTASVVLKVRPGAETVAELNESKIQQFVANSVENLNPRDVSVIISYLSPPEDGSGRKLVLPGTTEKVPTEASAWAMVSIAGVQVSKDSATKLKVYLFIFFAMLLIMSAVLIVNIVRTTRMREEFKALSSGVERPLLEGEVDEGPKEGGGGPGEAA